MALTLFISLEFWPVLLGRVYRFEDISDYMQPLFSAVRRQILSGHLPLWDRGAFSGQPIFGDPQLGIFYPPNWLCLLVPVLRGYALLAWLHALFGGFGMVRLCRARGTSRAAAVLAGVALGSGSYVVLQVRHLMFIETTAWLPWIAWAGWRAIESDGERRHLVLLALTVALCILSGGVSMLMFGIWFVVAIVGVRLVVEKKWRLLSRFAIAAVLGLLLAAPMWLPTMAHAALSPRGVFHGLDGKIVSEFSWPSYRYALALAVPNFLGSSQGETYAGIGNQWEVCGDYAGMLPFLLATVALFFALRQRRLVPPPISPSTNVKRAVLRGRVTRLAKKPQALRPSRALSREGAAPPPPEPTPRSTAPICRPIYGALYLESLVFAVMLLLALGLARDHSWVQRLAYHLPLFSSTRCPARGLFLFSLLVPLLAAEGADRLLAGCSRWRNAVACALLFGTAADLMWTHRRENPSQTLAEAEAASQVEALSFLRAHPGDRYVNDFREHWLHNSGLLWGVENASGYHSLPIWRTLHYLWIANHGVVYSHTKLQHDLAGQGLWHLDSPLVQALSVRWFLGARPPLTNGIEPQFVLRFSGRDFSVWENLAALPHVWVVHRATLVHSAGEAAEAIAQEDFDPKNQAILEVATPPLEAATGAEGQVDFQAHDGELEAVVDVSSTGLMVFSEPFYPGWTATLDGKPAEILACDYALRALVATPGRHHISMTFRSKAVTQSLWIASIGALILVLSLSSTRGGKS